MKWFRELSMMFKILISVAIACMICAFISLKIAIYFAEKDFRNGLIAKSRTIHSRINEVAKYVSLQGGLKTTLATYAQKFTEPGQLSREDKDNILKQVPIYAAMKIGSEGAEKENYIFRVFSDEPRNENNLATKAELDIMKKFIDDPKLEELVEDNKDQVTVYRPIRIHKDHGCMVCHGDPSLSPWKNGKDILGHNMENWSEGKLHGVFAIINKVNQAKNAIANTGELSSLHLLTLFIGIGALMALTLSAFIIKGSISSLKSISKDLESAENQLTNAANQVAGSSENISKASTAQAAALEEALSSFERIETMIKTNAQNANKASLLSAETKTSVERGDNEITQLKFSIENLAQSSKKIEQILSVIDDIAFQTNLLSLNAAVEAARAGEQGKGFAIVADAVRKLAQNSASSAYEISSLIKENVKNTEESSRRVETCHHSLTEILENINKVSQLNKEISNVSAEQTVGMEQISLMLTSLDQNTQANAQNSVEGATAAEKLSNQAYLLKGTVSQLLTTVQGKSEAS